MDKNAAKQLIENTFNHPFDIGKYKTLSRNIFKEFNVAEFSREGINYIPKAFSNHIKKYARVGEYVDDQGKEIDILIVYLNKGIGLDKARTLQRNFVSNYLDDLGKDAALVAFTSSDSEDWKFSFITIGYQTLQEESGRIKINRVVSNAKRFSFLVGKNEANHTAQQQVIPLLINSNNPNIGDLEHAFSVEKVTNEFYQDYKKRFLELVKEINRVLKKDEKIKTDFLLQKIDVANFAKKLMGQIVFLYFVQKKGWLGIKRNLNGDFLKWGQGDKKFIRSLFDRKYCNYENFFNEVLEPLFYEALAKQRENSYYSRFDCKIPFLSGEIFEPMHGYNWQETDIIIQNKIFELILDTFDLYNFTVKEDDPLDKEVAVDPEMLGKVFENLLPENIKKGKGAFYTPRVVVHFMCQQSLINFLDTHLEIDKEDIALLVKDGNAVIEHDKIASTKDESYKGKYQKIMPKSIIENANEIDKLLSRVKICDPAIGSGAFPIGLLHEIVTTRNVLSNYINDKLDRSLYRLKHECIQNSIFGVDIDEGAIEIAKLRLWLSLIVDEDNIESIEPLPNLNFKIICGNSLLSRYRLNSPINDVFKEFNKKLKSKDYRNLSIKNLVGNSLVDFQFYKKINNDFLNESSDKKIIFRKLIEEIKNAFRVEILSKDRAKLSEARGVLDNLKRIDMFGKRVGSTEEIKKAKKRLTKLEMQKQDTRDGAIFKNGIEWRFEFPNLLDNSGEFLGFDILIANPPYIKEYTNKKAFDGFRKSPYYQGKMDLWYGFACIGIDLLSEKGIQCFIAQNNWITSSGASNLRNKVLSETQVLSFTDFNNYKVFKSAGIQTMIYLLKKSKSINSYQLNYSILKEDLISDKELSSFLNFEKNQSKFDNYTLQYNNSNYIDSYITFYPESVQGIFNSIKNQSISCLQKNEISQGIVPPQDFVNKKSLSILGDNYNIGDGIFNLNQSEYDELNLSKQEKELVKPFYTSSELSRYTVRNTNKLWIIYTSSKFKSDQEIIKYPKIKNHLDKFKSVITSDNKPYGLHRSRDEKFFNGDKILSLRKCQSPTFTYTDSPTYVSQTYNIIKTQRFNLKYLLGILNSKLISFWLKYNGKMQGNLYQIDKEPLLGVPIIEANSSTINKIDLLVTKIIDTINKGDDFSAFQIEMDLIIYKLYNLNFKQVLIVDEEFGMSEVEYNNFTF